MEMTLDEAVRLAEQKFAQGALKECRDLCNQILMAAPRHKGAVELFRVLPASATYDEAFWKRQVAISSQSAMLMLQYFYSHYAPDSVVDFGAGLGTWLRAAKQLGTRTLLGVDGDWVKGKQVDLAIEYHHCDLNKEITLNRHFDLALSLETAEHLFPERADSFVRDICRASDLVMFGAAMPHQGGDGHVNEQPPSYWIGLFRRLNYVCVDFFRTPFWRRRDVDTCYAQNSFLFIKSGDPRGRLFQNNPLVDVYHPGIINKYVLQAS